MDDEYWASCAADYDPDELIERLMNFSSDSSYETGLIGAAIARLRSLEKPSVASTVFFFEGRPCAPLVPHKLVDETVAQIMRYCAENNSGAPDAASLAIGLRRGWLMGWHEGFRAAQGTEARRAETATEIGGSVHDGPVAESDAPSI